MARSIPGILALLVLAIPVFGQDSGKFSGYMFGDYYYMAAHHNKEIEGRNGFWFRRVYFTYDRGLSEQFSIRFRLEMNSAGDFTSKSKLTPYIKDAYLKWKKGNHSIYLGISPTPTWGLVEKFWGYRSVEKTPLDLQKFGSSRDFGIAFKGALDRHKRFNYHLQLANGSSTGSETNKGKKVLLSLSAKTDNGFVVEGYVDFEARPGKANRYTLQGFAGYAMKTFRIGVHFAHQARQMETGDDLKLNLASVFAVARLSEKVWGFARVDRQFDPNPDGAKISYLPFDPTAKSTLVIAGLDFRPIPKVHLMPNVELVVYDETATGSKPDSDVVPRFTFFYRF